MENEIFEEQTSAQERASANSISERAANFDRRRQQYRPRKPKLGERKRLDLEAPPSKPLTPEETRARIAAIREQLKGG